MSAAATIRRMLDAGLTIEQALTALEAFEAESAAKADDKAAKKRADGAARQRAYVARKRAADENDANDMNDANDASSASERVISVSEPSGAYKDNRACADGNPNPLTTFGDNNTPLPSVSPPKRKKPSSDAFDRFYAVYPRHTGRKAAQSKFDAAVRSGVDPERMIEAAGRFAAAHRRAGTEPQFIPHPATWLHQGRYDDDDLPTSRAGPPQRGGGVAHLFAETLDRIAENESRPAQVGNPQAPRLLSLDAGMERGTDSPDGGGVPRPDLDVLIRGAVRRM